MKTYQLKKKLDRNMDLASVLYECFIYTTRWIVFDEDNISETLSFYSNGTAEVVESSKTTYYTWSYNGNDAFSLTGNKYNMELHLVYMDFNLIVFQVQNKNEYLILVATGSLRKLNLATIVGIESYIHKQQVKEKNDLDAKQISHETSNNQLVYLSEETDDDDTDSDDLDDDPDGEFSEYGDFTKEEIIYDYLQRQEEEQEEEDYYLQQMNNDD